MAATTTLGFGGEPAEPQVPGSRRQVRALVTLDNSYPAGGYVLTAAQFGLVELDCVFVSGTTQLGRYCTWVASTGALQVFLPASGTSAAADMTASTDLHLDSVVVTAYGL